MLGPHTGPPEINSNTDYGATETGSTKFDTVRQMVQHGAGRVGDVVSLLDDEKSTTPSTQGSSSVERDSDSDDEEPVRGPNKRRDRRMSRATTFAMKEGNDRAHDLTYRLKGGILATTEEAPPKLQHSPSIQPVSVDDSEEEDWHHDGTGKNSDSASFSTSASDVSVASQPSSAGVRLKLSQPKRDRSRAKTPCSNGRERPAMGAKSKVSTYKGTARICSHPSPPPRRLLQEKKRSFQSLKRSVVPESSKAFITGPGNKPLKTTQGNERTPVIETQIKVLYI